MVVRTDVPHGEVMAAWRHAGIGLVPSLWPEPFGLVAVEAMRSGVPVVASRIGALPGIVADGRTGILVTPASTAELRAAIRRLDDDPDLRRTMGAAGGYTRSSSAPRPSPGCMSSTTASSWPTARRPDRLPAWRRGRNQR